MAQGGRDVAVLDAHTEVHHLCIYRVGRNRLFYIVCNYYVWWHTMGVPYIKMSSSWFGEV